MRAGPIQRVTWVGVIIVIIFSELSTEQQCSMCPSAPPGECATVHNSSQRVVAYSRRWLVLKTSEPSST